MTFYGKLREGKLVLTEPVIIGTVNSSWKIKCKFCEKQFDMELPLEKEQYAQPFAIHLDKKHGGELAFYLLKNPDTHWVFRGEDAMTHGLLVKMGLAE